MAALDTILKMKQDFEHKFDSFLVNVNKDEMIDPVQGMRCERIPLVPDFGDSPFFRNDLENPYGEKGFDPESMYVYCHTDEEVLAEAAAHGAGELPTAVASLENDIRCALAFFASDKTGAEAVAVEYCRNIAKPVEDITDRNLAGAFNILLKSGLDKSVRSDTSCLERTWFTSEDGYIPGSQMLADFVISFRAYENLKATSRKDALVRSLYGSLKAYSDYAEKHRQTMGGLSLFIAHVRENFMRAHMSGQAKAFSFVNWNGDRTVSSPVFSDTSTHIMLLHECGQNENPSDVVAKETARMIEWFNEEVYKVSVSPKNDPSDILFSDVFFISDIEDGTVLARLEESLDTNMIQNQSAGMVM